MPATGVTSAVLTFDMPETGAYEFRFFANNGYTLLATSPVVNGGVAEHSGFGSSRRGVRTLRCCESPPTSIDLAGRFS